jgi:hypothetical protein
MLNKNNESNALHLSGLSDALSDQVGATLPPSLFRHCLSSTMQACPELALVSVGFGAG